MSTNDLISLWGCLLTSNQYWLAGHLGASTFWLALAVVVFLASKIFPEGKQP